MKQYDAIIIGFGKDSSMAVIDQSKIRNFCIVAHIDHGKSTLADRIIEKTGLLTSREMQAQDRSITGCKTP